MDQNATKTARNEIFQQLKPTCIELSELALRYDGKPANLKALEALTSKLLQVLRSCCQFSNRDSFDDKIADYVFFPLSHIFRTKEKRSDRLLDVTIQCVRMLLKVGWSKKIDPGLSTQLLILLTFLAGGTIGDESPNFSEEVKNEAFGALQDLFSAIGNSLLATAALIHSDTIPALGHCVTTILEGITNGPSPEMQEQALLTLRSVWFTVKDQDALVNFLPGTVSSLTKSLMPTTKARRSRKVLLLSLQVLERVIVSVLSDVRTCNLSRAASASEKRSGSQIDGTWLKATAAQVKLALANVVKLRDHDDPQVQNALKHLCIVVLDECHDSLSDSAAMMVETWMTLASTKEPEFNNHEQTSLKDLATIHPSIAELIKTTVYNWVSSLPRIVQTNDETAKHKRMQQISSSYSLISDLNIESEFLSVTLTESLINSVTTVLTGEKASPGVQSTEITVTGNLPLGSSNELIPHPDFRTILMPHNSQKQNREDFLALVSSLGTPESQLKMASETLECLRTASGTSQLAAYWLSFNLVKAAAARAQEFDDILMLDPQEGVEEIMLELYSFSTDILTNYENEITEWRLQAIAIEIVAYAAQSQKSAFRTELVDVLYPIVQLVGSPNLALREHAMTGLNIISSACGYMNTSDLIVDNVDYMVNAISMRLNTFDISPQAPQVLIMMIRLSGPALLPFLDDVIGSIFAALDNFHGYERLVEVLFLVLAEVVDSGSKSDQVLQITQDENIHKKKQLEFPSITEIAQGIQKLHQRPKEEDDGREHEDFPKQPWKSAKTLLDEANPLPESEEAENEQETTENQEIAKPPPTKTYTIIQKIARLTQNYLTSSSPLLRRHLLTLLHTASTTLSSNEDEYLPLINDIWPVLIKRLYDPEPFVVVAACEAISSLCNTAGDFLSSRFSTEWPDLKKLVLGIKRRANEGKKGGGRGAYATEWRVWEGLVNLLVAVVDYVRIDDFMFDDILEILGDVLVSRDDVREALEIINADAVWLEIQKRSGSGSGFIIEPPVMEGYQFVDAKILV